MDINGIRRVMLHGSNDEAFDDSVRFAGRLVEKFGAELHVVYIIDEPLSAGWTAEMAAEKLPELHQAMETLFPGSAGVDRRFAVEVTELAPGGRTAVNGAEIASYEVSHPSGAPPLALRLTVGGQVIAYTGDTAWTDALPAAAAGADLLIAEAYWFSKAIPYHLSFADLAAHRSALTCRRVVLTHMSADMLARGDQPGFETAWDGCVIHLPD